MTYYIIKLVISAVLIVLISEIAKRNSLMGAMLASIPLVSILAMIWMYIDTNDTKSAVEFSNSIVWLIIPSMTLFILFPVLIKNGLSFYLSLFIAVAMTIVAYYSVIFILDKLGIMRN
ncbi:MAG: hypothetical protein DSZ04_05810 [Sulfurimonas sp.]|nr:MAG: hypothetical protein DSZ04_05810 [Sulfurimonas sp.]